MRAVNLLPRDEQRVRLQGTRTPLLVAVGGIAAVTASAGVLGFSASGEAGDRRSELQAIESAIRLLPEPPRPAVSQGTLAQERSDRITALSAALSSRVAFDRLLRDISFVLPEDAWLTGVTALSPTVLIPATPGSGVTPTPSSTDLQGVTIQGATFSHAAVARVLSRLSVVPALDNVALTASALVEPQAPEGSAPGAQAAPAPTKGRPFVTFTVTASLRSGRSS